MNAAKVGKIARILISELDAICIKRGKEKSLYF
jgi:hypothetical protein